LYLIFLLFNEKLNPQIFTNIYTENHPRQHIQNRNIGRLKRLQDILRPDFEYARCLVAYFTYLLKNNNFL